MNQRELKMPDRTYVGMVSIMNGKKVHEEFDEVFYKDFTKFEHLPCACQAYETLEEYHAYKRAKSIQKINRSYYMNGREIPKKYKKYGIGVGDE